MTILSPDTLETTETVTIPYEEYENDNEHRTHIVNPPSNPHLWKQGMTSQDIVDVARMTGQKVKTLCGFEFVPVANPEKYDVCQPCFDIAAEIMREVGQ